MKRVFLSYSHKNIAFADEIDNFIKSTTGNIEVIRDIRDLEHFRNIHAFMQRIRESDFTITLVSQEYLKSRYCMYEISELIKEDKLKESYLNKTLPVILPSALKQNWNIYKLHDHYNYGSFWEDELKIHEDKLIENENFKNRKFYNDKREKLLKNINWIYDIYKTIFKFLEDLNSIFCINYDELKGNNYYDIIKIIDPGYYDSEKKSFSRKELKIILDRIGNPSTADPLSPEFPYDNPKFPATETKEVFIENFGKIYIKDESQNPTGTHKDRMAWETMVFYKKIIDSQLKQEKKVKLPRLSIISAGSTAFAIQTLLKKFKLPSLKVLIDKSIPKNMIDSLKNIGCKIYIEDLNKKLFSSKEILELTDNKDGIDITFREIIDPQELYYFDWLSYEILNQNPDYCFVPFGTGDLYFNLLNINKYECLFKAKDPRMKGNINILTKCNFFGAYTNNSECGCYKLYNKFNDFNAIKNTIINRYIRLGAVGDKTDIILIKKEFVDKALLIAERNNIETERSGIAGLAVFLQMMHKIPKGKKVIIVNTGKVKT